MGNLLALDQSSKCTGWSIFKDGVLHEYGHFTFNDTNIGDRLCKIRTKILNLIDDYRIDEIIFEDIQLQEDAHNNVKTFKILAEVYGIVDQLCYEYKIPCQSVMASSWKSKLGIKGRKREEQKQNALNFISSKYHIQPTQDEADAICIGLYAVL